MARPKIGIFGALCAMGGVLAWRWMQKRRSAQTTLHRDLTRWEGEGGAVTETVPTATVSSAALPTSARLLNGNGADHSATGDAWPFPRS